MSETTKRPDSREMVAVHDMFRREFSALPGLAENVEPGDEGHTTVVADHVDFVAGLLHAHHAAEDALLWPKLQERTPGDVAPLLSTMQTQHNRIDQQLDAVDAAMKQWRATPDEVSRDAAVRSLRDLLPTLEEHLATEEAGILSLIDEHLSAPEFAEVGRHGLAHLPPSSHPLLFGMLLHDIDPEMYELVRGTVPAEIFDVVSVVGPQEYAAHRERLLGRA
ncbi:hemerythrin domain-containing protein [Streptomyces werraensis]|uniref:hemerythrin domain-containing protein n=1 Tax=Streptomyces werraensis TaxID=68284 RepID=UPI001CE2DBF1